MQQVHRREKRKASASSAGGGAEDAQAKRPKVDNAKPTAWDAGYWRLLRFVEAHGHARVPVNFTDDPALGRWVGTQRQAYAAELERKAGREPRCGRRITAARIKKLQRIGFEWTL